MADVGLFFVAAAKNLVWERTEPLLGAGRKFVTIVRLQI